MVAPLIAALGRAAAGQAAKQAVKQGAKQAVKQSSKQLARQAAKEAGKLTRGDELYNARRRFTRAAERYEKKAREASGTLADKYRKLAQIDAKKALATYEKQPQKGKLVEMAERLDIDIDLKGRVKEFSREQISELTSSSKEKLESSYESVESRRERETTALLNSNIGRRVYGGLSKVWLGHDDINAAITKHFGVDSMSDVLEIIEKQVDLYSDPDKLERYDEIRGQIELAFA